MTLVQNLYIISQAFSKNANLSYSIDRSTPGAAIKVNFRPIHPIIVDDDTRKLLAWVSEDGCPSAVVI